MTITIMRQNFEKKKKKRTLYDAAWKERGWGLDIIKITRETERREL